MLSPKAYKFIKVFKRTTTNEKKSFKLSSNVFCGLISLDYGILTAQKYELIRRYVVKRFDKKSKPIFKLALNRSLTKKGSKSRMGKGIGSLNLWYAYVRPGNLIMELVITGNSIIEKELIQGLNSKLTFSCKVVYFSFKIKFKQVSVYPIKLLHYEKIS